MIITETKRNTVFQNISTQRNPLNKYLGKENFHNSLIYIIFLNIFPRLGVSKGSYEHSEDVSTAFYFAITSKDQVCLASSEQSRKYNW